MVPSEEEPSGIYEKRGIEDPGITEAVKINKITMTALIFMIYKRRTPCAPGAGRSRFLSSRLEMSKHSQDALSI